jgi:hypothetical protein
VSESVAELLLGWTSDTPPGPEIVTVLTRFPDEIDTVPVTVKVTDPPTGRSTDELMLPLPFAGQLAPPLAEHVHVTPLRPLGMMSDTNEDAAGDGPVFLPTMV